MVSVISMDRGIMTAVFAVAEGWPFGMNLLESRALQLVCKSQCGMCWKDWAF